MAVIEGLICTQADGTISFGNYQLAAKSKVEDFEHNGDMYKVKTFREITKLERNGMFVYESVPGTTVRNLQATGVCGRRGCGTHEDQPGREAESQRGDERGHTSYS